MRRTIYRHGPQPTYEGTPPEPRYGKRKPMRELRVKATPWEPFDEETRYVPPSKH